MNTPTKPPRFSPPPLAARPRSVEPSEEALSRFEAGGLDRPTAGSAPAAPSPSAPIAPPSGLARPPSEALVFRDSRRRPDSQAFRFSLRTNAAQENAINNYMSRYARKNESKHEFLSRALFRGLLMPLTAEQESEIDKLYRRHGGDMEKEDFLVKALMQGIKMLV